MPTKALRLLGCALAFLTPAAFAQLASIEDIATELSGKLVSLRGKSVLPYDAPDLPKAKYIALYFSAGWCPPCHQFTPLLVKFYQEMKPRHPEFEVVLMSLDQGQNAMEKHMSELAMPWPAMRFSALHGSPLLKYAGTGIPDLVVLNPRGDVLSDSFAGQQYVGPYQVLDDLRKFLSADSAGSAPSAAGLPAPTATAAKEPGKAAVKSPSGTNWDEVFEKKSP
ncbi:MAG TPA: thioredoxin-like domain-containing protein [Chthoniobacterales bacterium]|jgi:nucleoredoxin|nr:thioredoxin-like domain-containing protein [Chthoniobacterales bacterium]